MSAPPRLITFAGPAAYLRALARLPVAWDVHPGRQPPWSVSRRAPAPMRVLPAARAHDQIARGRYDGIVCHGFDQLEALPATESPIIAVVHRSAALEAAFGLTPRGSHLAARVRDGAIVFASDARRRSWDLDGVVIPAGIDVSAFPPTDGSAARVLLAGHLRHLFPPMTGADVADEATAGLPTTVLGFDPGLPAARPIDRAFGDALRTHRAFLNTTRAPYEDGVTTAMVEAMASAMGVVALAHPDSPLEHGVNGYIGNGPRELRGYLLELLEDAEARRRLGEAARRTVAGRFSIDRFVRDWTSLVARVIGTPVSACAS
jgi:hypothetical protein